MKRLTKPSDAPADVVSAMELHAGLNRNTQYSTNIERRVGLARQRRQRALVDGHADAARQRPHRPGGERVDRRERATGIASEIDQIRSTLIGLANTQYAGRPIFAGTASGNVAYDANGNYVGISAPVERNIAPGQQIQVNVNGDAVFGTPGNDLFTTLAQISQAVRTDPTQLSALQATFTTETGNVQNQLAAGRSAISSGFQPSRAKTVRTP